MSDWLLHSTVLSGLGVLRRSRPSELRAHDVWASLKTIMPRTPEEWLITIVGLILLVGIADIMIARLG